MPSRLHMSASSRAGKGRGCQVIVRGAVEFTLL